MKARITALIVCLALASAPALAREAKVHKPAAQAGQNTTPKVAHKTARKPAEKKPAGKMAPAATAKAYAAMPADERLAIQANLAWTGYYEGPPGGDFDDERIIDAVKLFQKANKDKETGILSDEERIHLAAAAEPAQRAVGWRWIDDPATGARFGLPEKLVSPLGASRTGSRWNSGHSQIEIDDLPAERSKLAGSVRCGKENTARAARRVEHAQGGSVRHFRNAGAEEFRRSGPRRAAPKYAASPSSTIRRPRGSWRRWLSRWPTPSTDSQTRMPLCRRDKSARSNTVRRSSCDQSGDLIAARQGTADCVAITVPGFGHAAPIADDKINDLTLLRLYGARNLVPAALADRSQGDDLTLVGIADPAAQQGSGAVTKAAAHLDGQRIEPTPMFGFSGAAAIDARGRFAGMVEVKSLADTGTGLVTRQATLVPADVVRAFLTAHGITPALGHDAIDQSVLRLICVRK